MTEELTIFTQSSEVLESYTSESIHVLELPTGVGSPGSSAYQIAVANGFVGTVEEWLESLNGSTSGGVSDGNKGDITVSGSGATWNINAGAVGDTEIATGLDAAKISDGSVSNTEFGYLNGVTSAIQTQLDGKASTSHTHTASQITDFSTAADARITAQKGQNDGLASLDSGGKVPSAQLPSYVDDVLEYANLAAFPVTGTAGIIYVTLDTNENYRWSGSTYTEIASGDVATVFGRSGNVTAQSGDYTTAQVTESGNLYFTALRAIGSALTGFSAAAGTVSASDTILQAINKIVGNIANIVSSLSGKQNTLTLTTTGTSGAATLEGDTLNIPQYSGGGGGSQQVFVQDTEPTPVGEAIWVQTGLGTDGNDVTLYAIY